MKKGSVLNRLYLYFLLLLAVVTQLESTIDNLRFNPNDPSLARVKQVIDDHEHYFQLGPTEPHLKKTVQGQPSPIPPLQTKRAMASQPAGEPMAAMALPWRGSMRMMII